MDTEVVEPADLEQAPPPEPKPDLRKTWIIAGTVTIVALAAAMVGVKALDKNDSPVDTNGAQQQAFGRPPTAGKITAINGRSFTVQATDFNGATSKVKVSTDGATTYADTVDGGLTDLKVGDSVVADGTTANGVLTATRISAADMIRSASGGPNGNGPGFSRQAGGPSPDGQTVVPANFAAGEIKAITGDAITLSSPDGTTTTVKTTSATAIRVDKTMKFSDLRVGDTVRVTGTASGDSVKATKVTRGADGAQFFGGPVNAAG